MSASALTEMTMTVGCGVVDVRINALPHHTSVAGLDYRVDGLKLWGLNSREPADSLENVRLFKCLGE